jgi:hypothetical protein
MATAFKVQGELTLRNEGFVGPGRQSKAVVDELAKSTREATAANNAAVVSIDNLTAAQKRRQQTETTASQASAATLVSAKAQADGFARLAEQQAMDAAKKQSAATMLSVSQSTESLKALYGEASTAARASAAETEKVSAAGRTYEQVQRRMKAANDDVAQSLGNVAGRLNLYQRTQLGFQLNDVFVQLASGQGAVRTLVQQGPQITQIFGGVRNTLAAVPWAAAGYVAAIGAVVGITLSAINQLNEYNARQRQTEIQLQATGRAAQISAADLETVIRAEARRPGANRTETAQAAQTLLTNSAMVGDSVGRTLALSRDLARVTGGDLAEATAFLSSGLDGTVAGARKLDAVFNALTPAELEQIRNLEQLGQKSQAVGVVLTALERNLAGANEKGVSPLQRSTANLRSAWDTLLDSLAKTGAINLAAGALRTMTAPLVAAAWAVEQINKYSAGGAAGDGPDAKDLADARKSVQVEALNLQQLKEERDKARKEGRGDELYQFDQAIMASERRLKEGMANLGQLEARASTVAQKAEQELLKGQTTQAERTVKDELARLDQQVTIAGRRADLETQRQRAEAAISSGLLDPSQLARFQERLQQIRGELLALRTPAEEVQRGLDLESTLAKLPPHVAAAERAFLETKRQMLELGRTEAEATAAANQARSNALQQQATATGQQIQLLSAEAAAALKVAEAYGTSRTSALRLAAELKALSAEQQGQIAGGSAGEFAQRTLEEAAATAIATAAEKNEAYAREISALDRLVLAESRSSAAARETERANKVAAYAEELRAQAAATSSATIVAAAERQIAKYDELSRRELQAQVRRDANQLNRQYDPQVAYEQDSERLRELQATGLLTARTVEEATRESEQRRLEASRDATDGMIAGLRRYADEAMNAGQAAAQGMMSGLRSVEDMLVQIALTGQITWSNMVNSMAADLLRLTMRNNVTGPIAKWLGGINWGSIFGGGGGGGDGVGPGTGYTYHEGGIVGRDGGTARAMPAWMLATAPRLHGGGMLAPNERAAVLLADEEVLTRDDPRHRWNLGRLMAGGGGADRRVEIHVHPPEGHRERVQETDLGGGNNRVDIFFEQLKDGIADDIVGQRGGVFSAIAGTFGLEARGRS